MAERIILDPVELAPDRVEIDITPWIKAEGVDWDAALTEPYRSDAVGGVGQAIVDYRIMNRQTTIPLVLKDIGGTSFATARSMLQAKASLWQDQGGWIKRVTRAGGTVYADVPTAGLKLGGGWMQAHRDADPDGSMTIETLPDWYGDEVELDAMTGRGEIVQVLQQGGRDAVIEGGFPRGNRCRIVVTDTSGTAQCGMIAAFRSRYYSSATTAQLSYEAEAFTPLDTASVGAFVADSSGGTVVMASALGRAWRPVLSIDLGGTALTHAGSYSVRVRALGYGDTRLRLVWDEGDLTLPTENAPWSFSGGEQWRDADLGVISLRGGGWTGQIQAIADSGTPNVYLDRMRLVPLDEFAATVSAPPSFTDGVTAAVARDDFNQTAGTLTGKTLDVGGRWVQAGASGDFSVTAGAAVRTTRSDAAPRFAHAGTVTQLATTVVADVASSELATSSAQVITGVYANWAGTADYVAAQMMWDTATTSGPYPRIVGVAAGLEIVTYGAARPDIGTSTLCRVALTTDPSGRVLMFLAVGAGAFRLAASCTFPGSYGIPFNRAGRFGIMDYNGGTLAATRTFERFSALVPTVDAVAYASRSVTLATDGFTRDASTGTGVGRVSRSVGNLPRLPSGTTELFVRPSQGDLGALGDNGAASGLRAQVFYRPCWLSVPG